MQYTGTHRYTQVHTTQLLRTIIGCVLLLFATTFHSIMAQTSIDTAVLRTALQVSPIVFEGQVESICPYKDPITGLIYSNNIIHITKTIKGGLQCGTVSILTEGGFYQDQGLKVSHTTEFKEGVSGIFICRPSNAAFPTGCPSVSNPTPLELIFSEHATINYFDDLVNELAIGYNSKFNNIQELYDFITQVSGLAIVECDPSFNLHLWKNNNFQRTTKLSVNTPETVAATHLAAGGQLIYSFSSLEMTGDYPNLYFEFNIQARANDDSTFLEKATVRFKYQKITFGNIPILSLSATSDFPSSTYQATATYISDSTYEIKVSALTNATNRTQLSSNNAKPLIHVKIPFWECGNSHSIRLDSFANAPNFSTYTLTRNSSSASSTPYSSVVMNATRQGMTCTPEVTEVYSLTTHQSRARAGIKEQVKVVGKSFLNYKGSLYILDADKGGNAYIGLDNYDINYWSDTSIIFTLPSRIDSFYSTTGYISGTPGTGPIIVKNIKGQQSDIIVSNLDVPYAVTQVHDNWPVSGAYFKNNLLLYSNSIDTSFTFRMHTSITDTRMKACIRHAIRKWSCHTGVKFKLDETPTSIPAVHDNLNVIQIDSVNLDAYTIAKTFNNLVGLCQSTNPNNIPPSYVKDMDIKFNPNFVPVFFYDTTGLLDLPANTIDFFAVILHELGHTHMIQHVIDDKNVMWWENGRINTVRPANKRRVNITLNAQDAGDYIMENSGRFLQGISCPVAFRTMPRQPTACRSINPVDVTYQPIFKVYPNPFEDLLNIEIDPNIKQHTTISLLNLTGRTVKQTTLDTSMSNLCSLPTNDIPKGLYILVLDYGNQVAYKKIVCLNPF